MLSFTPSARNCDIVCSVPGASFIATLSVNSTFTHSGEMRLLSSASLTCPMKAGWEKCLALTLMLTYKGCSRRLLRCQDTASKQAAFKTQQLIGTTRPDRSATGMKTAGDTEPESGGFQRSNASNPSIRPV